MTVEIILAALSGALVGLAVLLGVCVCMAAARSDRLAREALDREPVRFAPDAVHDIGQACDGIDWTWKA